MLLVADYAVVSLHCLRIYLEKSYREALDLLSEMPQILAEIGLEKADLPHHSTLVKAFERIQIAVWRVLLRLSSQLHELSGQAAMDATFFDRETASKHYCRRTNYRVQTLKVTVTVSERAIEQLSRSPYDDSPRPSSQQNSRGRLLRSEHLHAVLLRVDL